MVEASATTNLSEVNADYLRLWQPAARNHVDVRDIFVDKGAITEPTVVETPIGGTGEVDTSLEYQGATNEQVPGLKGLLDYMAEQYPPCPVNKYVTINRKQEAQFQGDTWVLQRKMSQNVRNLKVSVEQYAPVLNQRKVSRNVRNVKVSVESYAPVMVQRQAPRNVRNYRLSVEQYAPVMIQRQAARNVRNFRVSVEQYAPALIQRQVRNAKVVRPIYVFAPY